LDNSISTKKSKRPRQQKEEIPVGKKRGKTKEKGKVKPNKQQVSML